MKKIGSLVLAVLAFSLLSCAQTPPLSPELEALLAKWEEGALTLEEWDRILFLQFQERDDIIWVVEEFEVNKAHLAPRLMPSLYYATALCKMAGQAEKVEDRLLYVRRGIGEYERIAQDFPQEIRVFLWRGITFSHFPDILGMDGRVLEDMNAVETFLGQGRILEAEEMALVVESYLNLGENFKNTAYLDQARRVLTTWPETATPELQERLAYLERKLGS